MLQRQVDPRPLPELLGDLTGKIDWHDLNKVKQKCARLASDQGYFYFGLQSFGQCRSGKDAESTYNRDGVSNDCKSLEWFRRPRRGLSFHDHRVT